MAHQQQQQSSRLSRLLTLLETGSTSATRLTAARQIGEIAKQHPAELQAILKRVRQFLQSKSWETRVAAAQAVGAIAENVNHVTVKGLFDKAAAEQQENVDVQQLEPANNEQSSSTLAFSSFDILRVLEYGAVLAASGGQEYDLVDNSRTPAERLAKQKRNLRRRLGLSTTQCSGLDDIVDVNDMIVDEDLMAPKASGSRAYRGHQEVHQLVATMAPLSRTLSVREKNMLKRKAKVVAKDDIDVEEPVSKRAKPVITESQQGDKLVLDSVLEEDGPEANGDGHWPFERFASQLMDDMFDPIWEIRHGSIMGLRDILSSHAACAAVTAPEKPEDSALVVAQRAWRANTDFLQDCTLRIICVMALDRFGDFVSDQVVAPVRETCAQVLGAVFKQMHPTLLQQTLNILLQMQQCRDWEVRHGSLLGIKYLVAVRQEMISDLFLRVLPACQTGLEDRDDDVRAVAADALIPASNALVSHGGPMLKGILVRLWDILLDLDDLSPSTSSVMHLLAELYSQPEALSKTLEANSAAAFDLNEAVAMEETEEQPLDLSDLSLLAPRLWPFMRHNISSVRHAAIRTLEKLLEAGNANSFWALAILSDLLRVSFQNLLLEVDEAILQCSLRVWRILVERSCMGLETSTMTYFPSWLRLASTANGASLEVSSMFSPTSLPRGSRSKAVAKIRSGGTSIQLDSQRNLDVLPRVVVGAEGEKSAIHMRVASSTALGILAAKVPDRMLAVVVDSLNGALSSQSGIERQVAAMVLVACFKEICPNRKAELAAARHLTSRLEALLSASDPSRPTPDSPQPYAELVRTYAKMRGEAATLIRNGEAVGITWQPVDGITIDGAIELAEKFPTPPEVPDNDVSDEIKVPPRDAVESVRHRLAATAKYLKSVQANLHAGVLASLAAAVVWMGELSSKLNPIIHALLGAIRREQEEVLQKVAAESLVEIIAHRVGRPNPNDKLIKTFCTMACADVQETPMANETNALCTSFDELEVVGTSKSAAKKSEAYSEEELKRLEGILTRRGAELALKALCDKFGEQLFEQLPKLWECITEVIKPSDPADVQGPAVVLPSADPQVLINNLQVIRSISPFLEGELQSRILTLLPAIFGGVRHPHAAVRLSASKCIGAMAKSMKEPVMNAVLSKAMPMLKDTSSIEARQGAGMLVTILVNGLGAELVAYSPLLIVPLLGCMGDNNQAVRQSVTQSFATLVPLLPLARGMPPPLGHIPEDTRFLEQLLDNSRVDDYKLAFDLAVPLRRYQQEGINWLAFLKRFKLHGILCDDMGLGKTLQASAMVASDTAERARESDVPSQSLIVCPSTLVGHWAFEIEKFIPSDVLKPLQYVGNDRAYLRGQFPMHNVIITSYDVLRKDVDFLSQTLWNFYILDEGHIIKNGKSKVTLAVKRVQAEHRLILSGTPIQNNVLELWSLFDFLMPGFLGTERQFQASYGKPLLAARDAKCSAKEAEAGVFAMEALHKQVMPFLLRRTKDEVLADLPPKIIQDRYCDLCPVQLKLYESFSQSQAKKDVSKLVEAYGGPGSDDKKSASGSTHVFQALQYLRKVCSHPLLVVDGSDNGVDPSTDLHDIQNSPKLLALKDILEECGIGQANGGDSPTPVGQHRVLIFAQLKGFLDIIEKDLFQTHMKSVTYLRLDGSVAAEKRFEIVKAFNSDPTIDVLLLTTHVGGLGLNLTTADTVVFMEHDWNPMRDLQAMDRAHRLGQRRVVNVHRLIMRGTMEEKIMGLQKFKLSVANTVINADNASLNTMDTGQLLDLFTVSGKKISTTATSSKGKEADDDAVAVPGAPKGLKAMLSSLEELWDESLYSEEYNLGQFVARLK